MDFTKRAQFFRRGDFDAVYYDFFKEVWASGDVYADPSGWNDTESKVSGLLPIIRVNQAALGRYYLDEDRTLGSLKEEILELIEFWEKRALGWDEITLYNSVSTATTAILIALKRLGAKTVVFESPAYGVTVNQAEHSGFKVILIPTYQRDNFALPLEKTLVKRPHPVVYWLTQPRVSLGLDQEEAVVERLLSKLSAGDFLVIDEATEQRCPAILSRLCEKSQRVLRIRGLLKPLGLNGLRLACVLHSVDMRAPLENAQDIVGASLDLYSLQMAAQLAKKKELFFRMISIANKQVTGLRRKAEFLALGTEIKVSNLVNGYMGCVLVPFNGGSRNYDENRSKLLNHCRSRRMPVILGSSMLFAFDPAWEQIRFNYFSREQHILRAIEVLTEFTRGIT